jgi:dTMP kinase
MGKPLFIVFDGIDGNGKSTQANLLREWLEKQGLEVFPTSEPSQSEYGKQIDELLRKKDAAKVSREKWIELFTQDRTENLKEIRGALQEGKIIICDRYYYSTLAYQLDEEEWQAYISRFLMPDITIILDVPAETGLERTKEKYELTGEKKAYFEKLNVLKKARKKFLMLPRYLKDNIKIIDSSKPIETVSESIRKEITLLL